MNFKPAGTIAQRFGVKLLVHGPPGGGKTPLTNTAPRPVLLITEPGMLSMRGSNVPACEAYDTKSIAEFFVWLSKSNEAKAYDTVCVDSLSELAETVLKECVATVKDGRAVYGKMATIVMEYVDQLFFMPQKHVYLISKMGRVEELSHSFNGPIPVTTTIYKKVPYFPGQELGIKVPHRFDEILYIAKGIVPGVPGDKTKYIRTSETSDILARDRSGQLAEYEPHDLTALFKKAMS